MSHRITLLVINNSLGGRPYTHTSFFNRSRSNFKEPDALPGLKFYGVSLSSGEARAYMF